jgi:hypothetical protein
MRLPGTAESDRDDRTVVEEMRQVGAVSPATARPARALPPAVAARLAELVERGVVREGAPGTYYLCQAARRAFGWRRLWLFIALWLLLILLPVAFVGLTTR